MTVTENIVYNNEQRKYGFLDKKKNIEKVRELSEKYGMENLRGLGYNWDNDSIEYVIGLNIAKVSQYLRGDKYERCKM